MRLQRVLTLLFVLAALALPVLRAHTVEGQAANEAPAAFDNETNGFAKQNKFKNAREAFEEREEISDGLGPCYNAQSCAECHQNPVSGAVSQIVELRAGHYDGQSFVEPPGGSLVHSRAIDASIQERVRDGDEVRAFRASLNTLGDGFVEAIDDLTLISIADSQPDQSGGRIAGQVIRVPVLEASGTRRVARFGWKNQHASLVSFAADAYLNEMGITNELLSSEDKSNGHSVASFDTVPDPENVEDVTLFVRFMRSTKAPPRDEALAATADAQAGSQLFDNLGCAICHVRSIVTAAAGTVINGGTFTVPPALGNKIIHPFSDFLLHDVGTGDGIVQNGPQSTMNKMRTPPLWGVRTRDRLMHDGQSLTFNDAILRHGGEANFVTRKYSRLEDVEKRQLIAFLSSL
jgi:CxxC motif-containing protein (DUF1111 family)